MNWWEESEGYCRGMSISSLFFYLKKYSLPNGYENTYQIPKDEAAPIIKYFQSSSYNPNVNSSRFIPFLNESREYEYLKRCLNQGEPAILDVYTPVIGDLPGIVHAVVAYKIIENGDIANIYIYDPNYPFKQQDTKPFGGSYRICTYNMKSHEFHYEWDSGETFNRFFIESSEEIRLLNKEMLFVECPVNVTIQTSMEESLRITAQMKYPMRACS